LVQLVQFLFGVALLSLGASWLVRGASTIAIAFGIPKHVIGLTLVALGTSAPEFFVNVIAAWHGETDFALSNVSGSNLANLCVGFGLCAFVASVTIRRKDFGSDVTINWAVPLVIFGLMSLSATHQLPFLTVIPLCLFLVVYGFSLTGRSAGAEEEGGISPTSWPFAWLLFVAGITCLFFGGEMVLHAAITTAERLNVPEDIIGLTIVAFGTSVPDITASVVAARKNEHGIAVGNIVGSNISNLLVVLNSTIIVSGQSLPTNGGIRFDYLAVTAVSLFCWILAMSIERVPKWAGLLLLLFYVVYLTIRVIA
jgi:cation:H+ antiporter